jgi:hypothetical protein
VTDHQDDFSEAGARRVVHAVVEQRLAARAHGGELLQPAVAGPEPGRQNDEGGGCYGVWRIWSRRAFRPRASCVSTVFSQMPSRSAIWA